MNKILCVVENDSDKAVIMNGVTILGVFSTDELLIAAKQKYIEFITTKPCEYNNPLLFEYDGSIFKFEIKSCELDIIDSSLWECANFICTNQNKLIDTMPSIESIEGERLDYIKSMREYLEMLKSLPKEEACNLSRKNLFEAGIIDESGNLAERYKHSSDIKSKRLVYGCTCYGKSYNYSKPIILENDNVILITPNTVKDELSFMELDNDTLKVMDVDSLSIDNLPNKIGLEIGTGMFKEFVYYLNRIKALNIHNNPNWNIIIEGFERFENKSKLLDMMHLLSDLKCNALCVLTCSNDEVDYYGIPKMKENKDFKDWDFISVCERLYKK